MATSQIGFFLKAVVTRATVQVSLLPSNADAPIPNRRNVLSGTSFIKKEFENRDNINDRETLNSSKSREAQQQTKSKSNGMHLVAAATRRSGLLLLLVDVDQSVGDEDRLLGGLLLQGLLGNGVEGSLDVGGILGAGLEARNITLLGAPVLGSLS